MIVMILVHRSDGNWCVLVSSKGSMPRRVAPIGRQVGSGTKEPHPHRTQLVRNSKESGCARMPFDSLGMIQPRRSAGTLAHVKIVPDFASEGDPPCLSAAHSLPAH